MLTDLSSLCALSPSSLTLCTKAILHRGIGSPGKGTHERISIGDVVQVLLNGDFIGKKFLDPYTSKQGAHNFFVIGGF